MQLKSFCYGQVLFQALNIKMMLPHEGGDVGTYRMWKVDGFGGGVRGNDWSFVDHGIYKSWANGEGVGICTEGKDAGEHLVQSLLTNLQGFLNYNLRGEGYKCFTLLLLYQNPRGYQYRNVYE